MAKSNKQQAEIKPKNRHKHYKLNENRQGLAPKKASTLPAHE